MLLIGLTGPSGSGKGAFSRILLEEYGIPSIDADAVYHALLIPPSPCLDALSDTFGDEILNTDGTLDRKRLASVVFSPADPAVKAERIAALNRVTHRFVLDRTKELLEIEKIRGTAAVVFDAPALYESGADAWCDLIVAVTADRETRIDRIVRRDHITREAAQQRVNAQHPDSFYTEKATSVLQNNSTEEAFRTEVREFYRFVLAPRLN
jgi:dephospho-CoA kinase